MNWFSARLRPGKRGRTDLLPSPGPGCFNTRKSVIKVVRVKLRLTMARNESWLSNAENEEATKRSVPMHKAVRRSFKVMTNAKEFLGQNSHWLCSISMTLVPAHILSYHPFEHILKIRKPLTMDPYRYQPLPSATTAELPIKQVPNIRLLTLLPGKGDEPIQCQLRIVDLHEVANNRTYEHCPIAGAPKMRACVSY